MSSYSKASRGLFVLLRVRSIFTPNSVSPGPLLRQCPIRYAFRAGRNLPDKEFRYLRTVIVTAAVHRGFSSELSLVPLTFRHWAGVSLYTSSCDFAQTCVFDKQSTGPFHCGLFKLGRASRRHFTKAILIPKLRINFAEFLNKGSPDPLGILYPSTSVGLRYGHADLTRSFSRQYGLSCFHPVGLTIASQLRWSFNPSVIAYKLGTGTTNGRPTYPSASLPRSNNLTRYRNINLLSIDYAFRPRLRPD